MSNNVKCDTSNPHTLFYLMIDYPFVNNNGNA